jgi:uncharacterized membrane protein YeiH
MVDAAAIVANISLPIPVFITLLDLFGTIAFAVTGAFKAIENRSDLMGIIILSGITGVAGGVLRDVTFGNFPPTALSNPMYIGITTITAIIIFFLFPLLKKHWNLFLKFDAVGLGVFTIIGSSFAYHQFGLNLLAMVFGGIITAIGGGIIRDILVNEIPIVLVKEIYASASLAGIFTFFVMLYINIDFNLASIISIIVSTSIRIASMKFNWNLPRAKL